MNTQGALGDQYHPMLVPVPSQAAGMC